MQVREQQASDRAVGREQELEAIERLLSVARERSSALVIEGDAGIGKSTLFREALRMAEAQDLHVLTCRAGASEATMSLAAIGDLLEVVPTELLDTLPRPQRRAVDVTMLKVEPGEVPIDQRAVAAGLRSLLIEFAASAPVLLAVDDVQWLDAGSAAILGFVLRRLGPERVGLLVTHRTSEPARLDLEALSSPSSITRLQLGPLSLGALQHMIRERLGTALPRSILVRVHTASQGNPLFALEIARVLAERETTAPADPLPVPNDVRELVGERVGALPDATRDLLLATALLANPKVETLTRAFGRAPDIDLEPAERAGIASLDVRGINFAHPLYAAAVIATGTSVERRLMHARLGEIVQEREERARHIAMATSTPDEKAARIVEEGAEAALARGGLQSAAELLERAESLTPPDEEESRHARGIRASRFHMHSGDLGHARSLLRDLLSERLTPSQRAEALSVLATLAHADQDIIEAERLLHQALETTNDANVAGRIQTALTYVISESMDFARAAEYGNQALASLEGTDDEPLLAEALAYCANADFLAGRGVDWTKVERALQLEDPDRIALPGLPPSGVAALIMGFAGKHRAAREQMGSVVTRLAERGDEVNLGHALIWMSWFETRCGNLAQAAEFADEAITTTSLADNSTLSRLAIAQRAWVDAHLGEVESARRGCTEARPPGERAVPVIDLWIAATLTLTELSVGDHDAAWRASSGLVELIEEHGIAEPTPLFFLPEAVETLIALGELDRAETLIETLEDRARELERVPSLASAGRCQGLLLAARGDLPGAIEAVEAALIHHEQIEMAFERARTLLVKGICERRSRARARARASIEEAIEQFESMGATLWAERARSELDRVGGRPARDKSDLTPSEGQVVELAIEGLSNKEIAAQLVVSVHTVEVHLSHAYAKLGIRSRSQLSSRLTERA